MSGECESRTYYSFCFFKTVTGNVNGKVPCLGKGFENNESINSQAKLTAGIL